MKQKDKRRYHLPFTHSLSDAISFYLPHIQLILPFLLSDIPNNKLMNWLLFFTSNLHQEN